jgi:hypothetical protein
MIEEQPTLPRQQSADLQTALRTAITHFRATALSYRNPRSSLHKGPRKSLAATYDDWARTLERHADALLAELGK